MADDAVKVLVTGGCGFIGSHLVDLLLAEGFQVCIVDNLEQQVHGKSQHDIDGGWLPDWTSDQIEHGVRVYTADVRNAGVIREILQIERPQVVVHLAAAVGVGQAERQIVHYVDTNVRGTAILLEAILAANASATEAEQGVRRFLVAGSMSAYGEGMWECPTHGPLRAERDAGQLADGIWDPLCSERNQAEGCPTVTDLAPVPVMEWNSLRPAGVYAATKRDQEELALLVSKSTGLSVAVPRLFNVVGPRQSLTNPYTGVAAIFAARCLAGLPPRVYEDGDQLRDFIHVSDVARAFLALIGDRNPRLAERTWANPGLQGVFNVSTGIASPIRAVAMLACAVLAPHLQPEITGQYRVGDIRACIGSPYKLSAATGWTAKVKAPDALRELYKALAGQAATQTQLELEAAHRELVAGGLLYTPPAPPENGVAGEEPRSEGETRWVG